MGSADSRNPKSDAALRLARFGDPIIPRNAFLSRFVLFTSIVLYLFFAD